MTTPLPGGYHFRPLAIDASAPDAWRALDRAVARWVVIHGGSPLLAQVAGWASLAEGHGDSALSLAGSDAQRHGMPALDDAQRTALQAEPMVASGSQPGSAGDAPFVIEHGYFYLRRNFLHEVAVAQQLVARCVTRLPAGQVTTAELDALFQGPANPREQAQRDAVAGVPGRRLFVLTGGPGTGKTRTVLRMLLMLIKQRADRGAAPPLIRLAAPTGKAAQRLSESLRDGVAGLRESARQPLPAAWQAHLHGALAAEAGTLHRLLGSRGRHGGFQHYAGNPLAADIVLVDEASMVDLAMLRALLQALQPDAALILVGDADQLTSVGTGSVLLDLVGALESAGAPQLARLQHSFRADHALVPINQAILAGDPARFATAWAEAGSKVHRRDVATAQDLQRALRPWCRELQQQIHAHANVPADRHDLVLQALDGLRARQLLCALREGEFGAAQVNAAIERSLAGALDEVVGAGWYPGRAVMIVRNDYAAGLFNGDVGLCLRDEHGQLGVWFERTAAHASGQAMPGAESAPAESPRRVVRFAPGSLPEHQGAFAVTIHKSQGSEYDRVAVLLPPDPEHRILSRQLLYTGASRARQTLEVWATDTALATALATPVRRMGGLAARLRFPSGPITNHGSTG